MIRQNIVIVINCSWAWYIHTYYDVVWPPLLYTLSELISWSCALEKKGLWTDLTHKNREPKKEWKKTTRAEAGLEEENCLNIPPTAFLTFSLTTLWPYLVCGHSGYGGLRSEDRTSGLNMVRDCFPDLTNILWTFFVGKFSASLAYLFPFPAFHFTH